MNDIEIAGKCLIISGGEYAMFSGDLHFDYVIACDRGYEYAERMGIKYDIAVGDFDSAVSVPEKDAPVLKLPAEKDDTDTLFAVRLALDKGYKDIHIICALGGRLDHTVANIQTAAFAASCGAVCHIYGAGSELHAFRNSALSFRKKDRAYISVFSLSDSSEGVNIKGTKYSADMLTLTSGFPIGVSNEWISDKADISVKNGIIAVVISERN